MKMNKVVEEDAARVFAVLVTRRASWTSARVAAREARVAIEVAKPALHEMAREGVVRTERRGWTLVYKPTRKGKGAYHFRLTRAAAELGLLPGPKMKPLPCFGSGGGQG